MQIDNLPRLLEDIHQLVGQYLETRTRVHFGPNPTDVEDLVEFGAYPPRDPSSIPRRALFAVGETLGAIGGLRLMEKVRHAYIATYGPDQAATLSAEWATAARSGSDRTC